MISIEGEMGKIGKGIDEISSIGRLWPGMLVLGGEDEQNLGGEAWAGFVFGGEL
jgi:hypothetical protein